jgi:hypothetical protein
LVLVGFFLVAGHGFGCTSTFNAGDLSLVPEWPRLALQCGSAVLPLTPGSRNGRLGGRRRASRLLSEATPTARPFNYSTVQDNGEPTFITKEKGRGEEAREGLQCTSISTPFLSPSSRTHMHAPACCSVSLHSTGALAPSTHFTILISGAEGPCPSLSGLLSFSILHCILHYFSPEL